MDDQQVQEWANTAAASLVAMFGMECAQDLIVNRMADDKDLAWCPECRVWGAYNASTGPSGDRAERCVKCAWSVEESSDVTVEAIASAFRMLVDPLETFDERVRLAQVEEAKQAVGGLVEIDDQGRAVTGPWSKPENRSVAGSD